MIKKIAVIIITIADNTIPAIPNILLSSLIMLMIPVIKPIGAMNVPIPVIIRTKEINPVVKEATDKPLILLRLCNLYPQFGQKLAFCGISFPQLIQYDICVLPP